MGLIKTNHGIPRAVTACVAACSFFSIISSCPALIMTEEHLRNKAGEEHFKRQDADLKDPVSRHGKSFAQDAGATELGGRVLVLVHGGGGIIGTTGMAHLLEDLKVDKDFLSQYRKEDMLMLSYNESAPPNQIFDDMERKLADVIQSRKGYVKIDIVGHSLGSFVAIAGASNDTIVLANGNRVSDHVEMIVSLAGVNRGQDKLPTSGGVPGGRIRVPAILRFLNPQISNNRGLQDFYRQRQVQINKFNFCSLYSKEDQIVTSPHDSGCMGLETNTGAGICQVVKVDHVFGGFRGIPNPYPHMLWVTDGIRMPHIIETHRKLYNEMKSVCWGFFDHENKNAGPACWLR